MRDLTGMDGKVKRVKIMRTEEWGGGAVIDMPWWHVNVLIN